MIKLFFLLIALPVVAQAQTCRLTLSILTEAPHGTLPQGTTLRGDVAYTPDHAMRMGSESVAYLTDGAVLITGPDGSSITGRLKVIHVVRAPHWADYMSFDIDNVVGNLGGVTDYEDPMLFSFYAERGEVASFDLPRTLAAINQFDRRRTFQVHTPDTMWTLPGRVVDPVIACGPG